MRRGAKAFGSEARLPALLPGRAEGWGGPPWLKVRTPFLGSRGAPDGPSSPAEQGPGHRALRRAGWAPGQFPKLRVEGDGGVPGARGRADDPSATAREGSPLTTAPTPAKVGGARGGEAGCEPSGPGPRGGLGREGAGGGLKKAQGSLAAAAFSWNKGLLFRAGISRPRPDSEGKKLFPGMPEPGPGGGGLGGGRAGARHYLRPEPPPAAPEARGGRSPPRWPPRCSGTAPCAW